MSGQGLARAAVLEALRAGASDADIAALTAYAAEVQKTFKPVASSAANPCAANPCAAKPANPCAARK